MNAIWTEEELRKTLNIIYFQTPKVKQALHPIDIDDADGSTNQESSEEPKSVYGWVICKVVSLEGKVRPTVFILIYYVYYIYVCVFVINWK